MDFSAITTALKQFEDIMGIVKGMTPALGSMIDSAELAITGSKQGAAKLELVKQYANTAFQLLGETLVTFEQVWPMLQTLISAVVAFRNTTGAFSKS